MSTRCEGCGQWLPADREHKCGEPNPAPPKIWPPERVTRLLELNAAGMSSAEIADELGCTLPMVVGKLYRALGPKPKPAPPPRPPKPPAPPPNLDNIPATLTNPCVEITDPGPEELEQSTQSTTPVRKARRPAPPQRRVVGPRFGAIGIKSKRAPAEATPPSDQKRPPVPFDVVPIERITPAVNIFELTASTCRWPLWGMELVPSSDHMFCGAETIVPGRYCSVHTTMAFNRK